MSEQKHTPRSTENQDVAPLAKRFLWADSAHAIQRLIIGLCVVCGILVVLDLIFHRHAYAPGEGLPGFYAVVGFVAFAFIVLAAGQLRKVILRNENYYAPFSVDSEEYPAAGLEPLNHTDLNESSLPLDERQNQSPSGERS